jgi:hypothetical protein
MVFYWPGCMLRLGGCGRLPMAGEASGAGRLGGRFPGLHLAAAVFRPWKATQGNLRSLLRQGQASLRSVLRSLDTRLPPWLRGERRAERQNRRGPPLMRTSFPVARIFPPHHREDAQGEAPHYGPSGVIPRQGSQKRQRHSPWNNNRSHARETNSPTATACNHP